MIIWNATLSRVTIGLYVLHVSVKHLVLYGPYDNINIDACSLSGRVMVNNNNNNNFLTKDEV